jgi:hypothetical protein
VAFRHPNLGKFKDWNQQYDQGDCQDLSSTQKALRHQREERSNAEQAECELISQCVMAVKEDPHLIRSQCVRDFGSGLKRKE